MMDNATAAQCALNLAAGWTTLEDIYEPSTQKELGGKNVLISNNNNHILISDFREKSDPKSVVAPKIDPEIPTEDLLYWGFCNAQATRSFEENTS